jgi:hypothetical protein
MATPPRLTWHNTPPTPAARRGLVYLGLAALRGDGSGPDDYSDGLSLFVNPVTREVYPVDKGAWALFGREYGKGALDALRGALAAWLDHPGPVLTSAPDANGYWYDGTASWPGDPNRVPYVDGPAEPVWYVWEVRAADGRSGTVNLAPLEPAGWMGDPVDVPGIGTVPFDVLATALGSPPTPDDNPTGGAAEGLAWTLTLGTGPAPAGAVTDAG